MAKHVIDDSPGGLAILLSRKHGSGDDAAPGPAEPAGDMPEGPEAAAHDLLQAIEAKDAEGIAHALHDAYSMCDTDDAGAAE